MQKLLIRLGVVIAFSTIGLIAPAYADAVFLPGNHPCSHGTICAGTEENILFHTAESGFTITGFTNHSGTAVNFTSTTDDLHSSGGQADIDNNTVGGEVSDIKISLPGGKDFLDFILDAHKATPGAAIMVTVDTVGGKVFHDTFTPGSGDNFLTIRASSLSNALESVTIDDTSGFADLRQPRISGITGVAPVSEPSTLLLFASGLLLAGIIVHRQQLHARELSA